MTDDREFDRLLFAFLATGTDELADRVIDAALDQIDHTRQRRSIRAPWRFPPMFTPIRLATAAVIGVLAVGGAFYLIQPGKPAVGVPGPTPSASASPSQAAATSAPTATPNATPDVPVLTGPMGVGRQIHTATTLADGRVLVAGGLDSKDAPLASGVLYDPKANTFSRTGSLAWARSAHTATLLTDGRVLIAGGGPRNWVGTAVGGGSVTQSLSPFQASAELYDPKTGTSGTFSQTGSMTTPRENHTATLLADGRVLITGGNDIGWHAVASAELFDPKSGTFSPTGSMAIARAYHTATLLADGRVLIAGGDPAAWGSGGPPIISAELYDPKTGTFTATGAMTGGRAYHVATLLSDGRVLITGGSDANGDVTTAELFDPKTGRFSPTGSMTVARTYHTATLLADGRVLVAGGGGDYTNLKFLSSAELYDPKTGTFTVTGSMADARTYHGATLLTDGHVLMTGGYGAQAPLPSAELYDPTTGTFSPAGGG